MFHCVVFHLLSRKGQNGILTYDEEICVMCDVSE